MVMVILSVISIPPVYFALCVSPGPPKKNQKQNNGTRVNTEFGGRGGGGDFQKMRMVCLTLNESPSNPQENAEKLF